jgi:hypothetical protein
MNTKNNEPIKITPEKLEKLYNKHKKFKLCEMLGITDPTLTRYLKKYNIPLKGKGNRTRKVSFVESKGGAK